MVDDAESLKSRTDGLDAFFQELMPCLVDFDKLGIHPSHQVLIDSPRFSEYVANALRNMSVETAEDRMRLLARVGYFVGEYLTQRYGGHWFVSEVVHSRYFARYVVGKFSKLKNGELMMDPFEVAQIYVDTPIPRDLGKVLNEVDSGLQTRGGVR